MNAEQAQRVLSIIEKVQVFEGLTLMEAQRLLKLCHYQTYEPGQHVYEAEDSSNELLILLQGKLHVVGVSGTVLGEIAPGTSTGEMGVLTGRHRSATVIAVERSAGFVIQKLELNALLRADQGMCIKIFRNMVSLLCERLEGANISIEGYARKTPKGVEATEA